MSKEKKRVLQLNMDGSGGAFALMYQLQKQLKDEFVFDFYWMGKFVKSDKLEELQQIGCSIYGENLRKNRLLGHILLPFRFYKFLKKHPYEIVHVNADLAYKMVIYAIPARLAGAKKIILHSHSSNVNGDFKRLKILLHEICKLFIQSNRYIHLTCSKLASKWMFNSDRDALMVNNGVDLNEFKFDQAVREETRKKLGVNDNIVIGTVGNLSYQKYPEYLIDIIASITNDEKYKVIFVGDGLDRMNVEAYAKKKCVEDRCIFWGNTDKVVNLLDAMDIYIMTSRFEGLPVSAIEAQANGLPCILSDKITEETKVLDSCEFASIEADVDLWVKLIKNKKLNFSREEAGGILKEYSFDIKDSAEILRKVYVEY